MSDNRTTELREKLDNLIIELDRLDITFDSPASDMTVGEYEQERENLLDEFIQAIAATLGGGECVPHGEWESISQNQEVRHVFCECGHELGMDRRDSLPFERTQLFAMPNYCQECGRKIWKAVIGR